MQLNQAIEQIKQRADIVEIVGRYVNLKKVGRNYRGLCPFHSEKTPSFFVNPALGIYKCFGCQAGGDVIKFIQEIEQINFIDAVKKLAQELGIEIDDLQYKNKSTLLYKRYFSINNIFAQAFHKALFTKAGAQALNYLRTKRRLTLESIQQYRIGFAPMDRNFIHSIAKHFKITEQELQLLGYINQEGAPKFVNRVMFPIIDQRGRVIGFSGRTLSQNPNIAKYLNTPETPIFHKREVLFNLYFAKRFINRHKNVIITEGQIDTITAFQHGIKNVVAPLGTALTDLQLTALKHLTKRVTFAYDNDSAGSKALLRSSAMALLQDLVPMVLIIPEEYKDLDEYINHTNVSDIQQLNIQDLFEFYVSTLLQLKNKDYAKYEELLESVLLLASLTNPIRQDSIIHILSRKLEISAQVLAGRLEKLQNDPTRRMSILSMVPQTEPSELQYRNVSSKRPNYTLLSQLLQIFTGILLKYPIYWLYIPKPRYILTILTTEQDNVSKENMNVLKFIHDFWAQHLQTLKSPKRLRLEDLQLLFEEKLSSIFNSSLHRLLETDQDINEFILQLSTSPLFDKYDLSKNSLKEVHLILNRILRPLITRQIRELVQKGTDDKQAQDHLRRLNTLLQQLEKRIIV